MSLFDHRINSWLAIILFMSMTLWVGSFYIIETTRLSHNNFIPDYEIYYEVVK